MLNPTFDIEANAPRPSKGQAALSPELEQRGWWISDGTMRTLYEMGRLWFADTCSNECDNYEDCDACPYGANYAAGCYMAQCIADAYLTAHKQEPAP